MLFAYDIVLIDKTKERISQKLNRGREVLESKCYTISRSKTEYIACTLGREFRRIGSSI